IGRIGLIGSIWAAYIEDDVAAERFLEQASISISDDVTLLRHCAREVLKAPFFRSNPLLAGRRLNRLLRDANESIASRGLIDRAVNDIGRLDDRRSNAARSLPGIADELERELNTLADRDGSLAPIHELAERLPSLLRVLAELPVRVSSRPSLKVRSLAPAL